MKYGILETMGRGAVIYRCKDESMDEVPWMEHARFKGIYLKHVVKGADTDGMLSCHIVRIEPNCVLDEHAHDDQWELHEVAGGSGILLFDTKERLYQSGSVAIIPKGVKHKVVAGQTGLVLLAKFFPAQV